MWTAAVLAPLSPDEDLAVGLHEGWRILLGKSLHFTIYAFLAVFAGWLRPTPRFRWPLLLLLAIHAGLTELGQHFIPSRDGAWRDVLINLTGLSLGVVLSWKWWRGANNRS